jgi:3-oxoacyl-[acyl-carrier protein] reductase
VTGATRGIGRAIADALAGEGARVIGTATTDEGAETLGAHLRERGGEGRRLDVRDAAAIDALLKDVETRRGAITILVNNSGITRDNQLVRMKDD